MKSPRNVAAANRWSFDIVSSTYAFPTVIFAGRHCGNEPHIVEATAAAKTKKTTSWREPSFNHSSPFPFLDLTPFATDDGQTTIRKKLLPRRKTSKVASTRGISCDAHFLGLGFGGSQSSRLSLDGKSRGAGVTATRSKSLRSIKPSAMAANSENHPLTLGSRPKSRSIAIIKNRDERDKFDEHLCSSTEQMYDWITWRMYTRITDHRRRFPIKTPYTHEPPVSNDLHKNHAEDHGDEPVIDPSDEHFFDGEVFELEL